MRKRRHNNKHVLLINLCKKYYCKKHSGGHVADAPLPTLRSTCFVVTCLNEACDLVLKLNGILSGEHGVDLEKRPFITREIILPTLSLMHQIKTIFDPNNILNPGKIFLN